MAVDPGHQGRGVGRALIEARSRRPATPAARGSWSGRRAADTGNLRFYQRPGVPDPLDRADAFTPATGYEPGLLIDGVELRDRVWLDRSING